MKILFVSRAYPPVVGGIENQNLALSLWLPKYSEVRTLANTRGKKFLPLFLPWVLLRILFTLHRYDALLLGDGVLGVVGFVAKLFYPQKTVASVIHGLDLSFQSNLYQRFWVQLFLPKLDLLLAVSQETKTLALSKGFKTERIQVIPNGIDPETLKTDHTRQNLRDFLGEDIAGKVVLLTAGRLAKRKGVAWFIEKVLPLLPPETLYLVAGDGPNKAEIETALSRSSRKDSVRLLGRVSDETRNLLLNTVDIFIQPNIRVTNDIEGFGIAVIEAAVCGRPVVASALEGLKDAITPEQNGLLVEPHSEEAFVRALTPLIHNELARQALGQKAAHYTEEHYHWQHIAKLYIEALREASSKVQ